MGMVISPAFLSFPFVFCLVRLANMCILSKRKLNLHLVSKSKLMPKRSRICMLFVFREHIHLLTTTQMNLHLCIQIKSPQMMNQMISDKYVCVQLLYISKSYIYIRYIFYIIVNTATPVGGQVNGDTKM